MNRVVTGYDEKGNPAIIRTRRFRNPSFMRAGIRRLNYGSAIRQSQWQLAWTLPWMNGLLSRLEEVRASG